MDVFEGITKFAQDQVNCIECRKSQARLNADITKLKNFVNRYKPNPYSYNKSIEAKRKYEKDLKEWNDLMML
jgi:hypothetical protein